MLLKKLNLFIEQVATYLQKDGKCSSSSSSSSSSDEETTTECIQGGAVAGAGITTGEVLGPDTPASSLANTYKEPPQHQKTGPAGIDTKDIAPLYTPAKPYKMKIKRKK